MFEHVPIILGVLVTGIMTSSTLIFSLACFFCYLFCNLIFDFIRIEEKLRSEHKQGIVVSKLVKVLSGFFVLLILASYWTINEFGLT